MDQNDKIRHHHHFEVVDKYIDQYFSGAEIKVFHEIPSLEPHVDIYHVQPQKSEYEVLITSGMSSIEMNVDDSIDDPQSYKFAELVAFIPKGLDFGEIYPSGTKNDWIISMMKQTASFPHLQNTWIGIGHTIQAEQDMKPYSQDTEFCGCMLLPIMALEDFRLIDSPHGQINLYGIFPMYREELEYKIKNGFNEFIQFLIKNNTKEIITTRRGNYCK